MSQSFLNSWTLVFLCTRVLLCTVVVCCWVFLCVVVCCCVLEGWGVEYSEFPLAEHKIAKKL